MASINPSNSGRIGNRLPGTRTVQGRFIYGIDNLPKNFEPYQGQHLPLIQQELVRQIKRKELTKLEEASDLEAFFAAMTLDETKLSREALAYLNELRRKYRRQPTPREKDFRCLMGVLSQIGEELGEELAELEWQHTPLEQPHQPLLISRPLNLKPQEDRAAEILEEEREHFGAELTQAQDFAHKMIAYSPNPKATLRIIQEIEPFGYRSLYRLYTFGLRIIVLERGRSYHDVRIANQLLFGRGQKNHTGAKTSDSAGIYIPRMKLIVMHENRLGDEHRSTLRHEIAHAWEDTYNIKTRRSEMGISVNLWYLFSSTRKGFVSAYAATKPAEFFAESVEAFYSKSRRSLLKAIDPETYQWLVRELD